MMHKSNEVEAFEHMSSVKCIDRVKIYIASVLGPSSSDKYVGAW